MGTPYGRQSMDSWKDVREWDKHAAEKLKHLMSQSIRTRFPHENCNYDRPCDECKSLIAFFVDQVRQLHELYLGHKLSELVNIRCPFPHRGD